MALHTITGFETGSALLDAAVALSGTASIASGTTHSGTYALRVNPTTTATGDAHITSQTASALWLWSAFDLADTYFQFAFRVATLPAADSEPVLQVQTSANANKLELRINSAGNLIAYAQDGTTVLSTGSTALSLNTWYRLAVRCGTSATVGAYEVQINGVSEFSGTGNLTATNGARIKFGKTVDRNGESVDFYYDDIIVGDSSASAWLGDLQVGVLVPNANGATMQWTSGTGSSDYQEVDEIPMSAGEFVESNGSAAQTALFAYQPASTLGVGGTIHGVVALVRIAEAATVTSQCHVRFVSGASDTQGAAFNSNTTGLPGAKLFEVDPNTSSAWTTGGIDAVEAGAVEDNAVAMRIHGTYLQVAWTPASGGRVTKNRPCPSCGWGMHLGIYDCGA